MEIENKTNYDTRYLRRLFKACEKYTSFWKMSNLVDYKFRKVKVIYARCGRTSGYAGYNTYSIVLKIPKDTTRNITHNIAQIYIHEVEHNSGKHHKNMAKWYLRPIDFWPNESLPLKVIKIKPKINIVEKREAKAKASLKAWQTKLKRAKTGVKKYQAKVRYYKKRKAASN